MTPKIHDPRRQIPSTDVAVRDLMSTPEGILLGQIAVSGLVREQADRCRSGDTDAESFGWQMRDAVRTAARSMPRRVINATGVILHTNLGRAPLSGEAARAAFEAAGYTNVEFDLTSGQRSNRGQSVVDLILRRIPLASSALVVNNNAGALFLATIALAVGREVIVSRGELVEIGNGFRIADLITSAGATLIEVGSTNRTHRDDYVRAITDRTAFILKVHPSNYLIKGFTKDVSISELRTSGVPIVWDIGSGLLEPKGYLPDEPDFATGLAEGASLVLGSGDKLLGGPQAGIIIGQVRAVEKLARHPVARALRLDKLRLASLDAALREQISPVEYMLAASQQSIRHRVDCFILLLQKAGIDAKPRPATSTVGGGSAPERVLDSWSVALPLGYSVQLRMADPPHIPVLATAVGDECRLDFRTIDATEETSLLATIVHTKSKL